MRFAARVRVLCRALRDEIDIALTAYLPSRLSECCLTFLARETMTRSETFRPGLPLVRLTVSAATLVVLCASVASAQTRSRTPTATERATERHRVEDSLLHNDFANFARYRDANRQLRAPVSGEKRVVFMGNSITEGWAPLFSTQFAGKPYVGRGIGGQTTPQMLLRFRADVVALKPAVVVLLAGTNDIAGNTGPSTLEMIEDNIMAMTEIAQANGIRVVLSSVLPVFDYPWKPGLVPAPKIVALNAWMRTYAARVGAVYLDYHTAMRDARDGLRPELGDDGVHPNAAGYRIMATLVEPAILAALGKK